jgi:hypothetical protein
MTDQERELDMALAEAEQENRLLRARNERLEQEAKAACSTIEQMIAALMGSGTKMRSDQWYVEIEAVAAGKHYLNSTEAHIREACALQVEQAGMQGYGTLAAAALIRKGEDK